MEMSDDGIPSLVVFDLDYTLWPFWVDTHVDPPFKRSFDRILDAHNVEVRCFRDVPDILEHLFTRNIKMAVASRTTCIAEAKELVNLFGWEQYFTYIEIFPSDKKAHFKRFHEQSGIPYNEMLFFDDESRNIESVSQLGVTCLLVNRDGMTMNLLKKGFESHASRAAPSRSQLQPLDPTVRGAVWF